MPENAPQQRDLPGLLSLLKAPDLVRADVLAGFGDEEERAIRNAIAWAWRNRRVKTMTQASASDHCGIKPPHFANIINGKKYLPPQKMNAFEWIVGNRALSLTIERFREIRKKEAALELASAFVESSERAA